MLERAKMLQSAVDNLGGFLNLLAAITSLASLCPTGFLPIFCILAIATITYLEVKIMSVNSQRDAALNGVIQGQCERAR